MRADLKKLYLVFHSYEMVLLLWAAVYLRLLGGIWVAIAIGLTQHLIFDQLTNGLNTFAYFFTYRASKGFITASIVKKAR